MVSQTSNIKSQSQGRKVLCCLSQTTEENPPEPSPEAALQYAALNTGTDGFPNNTVPLWRYKNTLLRTIFEASLHERALQ